MLLKKKNQEAKKKQVVVTVKEIQLRPRTEDHDLETKFRHIVEFLSRGDKVKITVMFRGREVAYAQQGLEMLARISETTKDFAITEQVPKLEGRRMIMVLSPGKNASSIKDAPKLLPVSAVSVGNANTNRPVAPVGVAAASDSAAALAVAPTASAQEPEQK